MEVKDLKEEALERAGTPEAKKKKTVVNIVIAVVIALLLGGMYLYRTLPMFTGTPHMVVVDGVSIEPGKTTVKELVDAGFQFSDYTQRVVTATPDKLETTYNLYSSSMMTDKKTYYTGIYLIWDNKIYGTIAALNESESKISLADCVIREAAVYDSNELCGQATIDGLAFADITLDSIKATLGEPTRIFAEKADKSTDYIWSKGNYRAEITISAEGKPVALVSKYERQD